MKNVWRSCRGLSLLETVMALALTALILTPLMVGFNLALKNWEEDSHEGELLQHARVAMQRITSELRYAAGIKDHTNPNALEFYTRTLVDNDWPTESMRYWREDAGSGIFLLIRGVDDGGGYVDYPIAGAVGSTTPDISVSSFVVKYFKLGITTLVELISTDPDYLVDVVEVNLTLARGANTVSLSSRVELRNK